MENRTEIASLGEFGLIDHLTKNFEITNASTLLGVGDDAAVIDHFGKQTVITTDLLIEGIHFDLMYTPLKHLGYKSVIVNLSDVYAMNATPTQITMSIAFSNRFSLEALDEFYEGVYAACEKYNVDLVGGDTTSSQKGFIISVTAIGEVAPDKFVKRSTAQKGDLICVSGDVLFKQSVGRTDFPMCSFKDLENSIRTKLYTLDDEMVVFPGHGGITTIGFEKKNNPFVKF